ncbi:MAG: sialate O-acetylesterase [Prolixibacteraceae bacterium]|nr:sialate O-acetylesterase [Prolixibacteraceae bacterium]
MIKIIITILIIIQLIITQSFCQAQLSMPKVFGDNMVLQRGIKIPVWGEALPGTVIIAELGTLRETAKTGNDGKWQINFPAQKAGGEYVLKVYEKEKPDAKIEMKGVLIGDVYLASGQSNMELQVQQAQDANDEIKKANCPQIRFLFVEHDFKLTPQTDIKDGKWNVCDTSNVRTFSAVAYYFARKINIEQNVPIGIIQSTWGGTPVESWTSREMLLSSPISKARVLANDTITPNHFVQDSLDQLRFWDIVYNPQNASDKIFPKSDYNDADWKSVEMPKVVKDFGFKPFDGIMWLRKKVVLPESFSGKELTLNLGHPEMCYSLYFNGTEICKNVWNANPKQSYVIPTDLVRKGKNTISLRIAMLWNGGGLNPPAENIFLTDGNSKISLTGTWLYNTRLEPTIPSLRFYHYFPELVYNAMINPLIPYGIKGFIWYQGEANDSAAYNYRKLFPMMITDWRQRWHQGNLPFLYVQLPNFKNPKPLPAESEWAELREAQTLTLSQPNTGMACVIDLGEADNIHPTNKQEVGRRLALVANKLVYKQNCIASGPMFKSYKIEGNRVRISFTDIGSGLSTTNGKEVTGFAVAGSNKKFYWAKATIVGNEVVVYSDEVSAPVAVRYAWADNPQCNLVNSESLPAIPFRTDAWKGITQH